MNWAQVLDDFIKIGLPALCTASVALLIAKFTRSHDFDKERRRRKQDLFEQLAEPFDDLTMRMESVLSSEETVRKVDAQLKTRATESLLNDLDLLDEATLKFGRIETKVQFFDLADCVKAFKTHQHNTLKLKGAVFARYYGREDTVDEMCNAWWISENEFRSRITAAFRQL
jgi:hypothetical protein